AKQELVTARTAAETYAVDNSGNYTGATAAELAQIEETLNGSPLTVLAAGPRTYRLQVVSDTTSVFNLERNLGGMQHSCNPAGTGGCRADGSWESGRRPRVKGPLTATSSPLTRADWP
ncbi:MAG: hypothetical protein WBB30_04635, partial [Solirubrobacterales bacterium]